MFNVFNTNDDFIIANDDFIIANDDFITHLSKYGVITGTNDDDQDEDLDSHMDAPIDNAIMLAES